MRVILLLCLMGFNLMSSFAYAVTNDDVNTLTISITNATPNVCKLNHFFLRQGEFYFASSIAEFIPAYATASPIILNSCLSAEIELSYTCGDNQKVTFNTKQINSWFSSDVDGQVLFSQNMTATPEVTKSLYHNAVNWRFTTAN